MIRPTDGSIYFCFLCDKLPPVTSCLFVCCDDGVVATSVPFTAEHLAALNAWVFQRVPVEEAGIVPAVLEWVKLESQLAYAQRRFLVLRKWLNDQNDKAARAAGNK